MKLLLLAVILLISGCQDKQKDSGKSRKVMEEPVDLEADRAAGKEPEKKPERAEKEKIKPKKMKWKRLYNRTRKDVPVFTGPSKSSEIKDYIRPDANVTVTGNLIVKGQEWYHGSVGWIIKGSLAEFNIMKFRSFLKANIPTGQFYNTSEAQREKAVKAFESGSEYDLVMATILKNVKYFDINPVHLYISLLKGSHDGIEFALRGSMRKITKVAAGKFKLICYGEYCYPEMLNSLAYASKFYSGKMPHKNSAYHLFTIDLEVLNKNAIRFKGKVYRRLKDQ